jgi:hypothetical protein
MSLDAVEFIRRFLLHVLPGGFVKIRHFGFLSNRNRKAMVQHCRTLLPTALVLPLAIHHDNAHCPVCRIGHLHLIPAPAGTHAENTAAVPLVLLDLLMMPTMIASNLARPDTLPDGEDSTSAPSAAFATHPSQTYG